MMSLNMKTSRSKIYVYVIKIESLIVLSFLVDSLTSILHVMFIGNLQNHDGMWLSDIVLA